MKQLPGQLQSRNDMLPVFWKDLVSASFLKSEIVERKVLHRNARNESLVLPLSAPIHI